MENFIIYIAKASGLIAVFLLAYHAFLRKETFFTSNRWFLLAGLFTSVLMPLVVYTRTIWVDPLPVQQQNMSLEDLVMLQHAATAVSKAEQLYTISWPDVLAGMYIAGVLFFFARFFFDFMSLRSVIKRQKIVREGNFLLVDSETIKSPFSFFNYIVYNSAALEPEELENIICHEKVHSSQIHSLDMLIGQVFCIVFWFNPFAWMYKKSMSQNLEFIADSEATKLLADKKAYQKTLLKMTVQPECIAITNHFFQSLIKKRIVMLNKKQSDKKNSWKYAVVLPALAAFMLAFQVQVVAQEKETPKPKNNVTSEYVSWSVEIHKDATDEEIKTESGIFKKRFDTDINVQNVIRNNKNEITGLKVTARDKSQSKVYEVSGNDPISPFTIEVEKNSASTKNTIRFGTPHQIKGTAGTEFHIVDDSIRGNHKIMKVYGANDIAPPAPPAPSSVVPPPVGHWSVNSMKFGNKDALIVINGVKQKKGTEVIKLPLNQEIDQINVLKNKEAREKYGKEGKNGVVEITTKREVSSKHTLNPVEWGSLYKFIDETNATDGDIEVQGFHNLDDFKSVLNNLTTVEFQILSEEDMEQMQGSFAYAKAELDRLIPELQINSRELSKSDYEETKREINAAKKEIESAKKEIEQARKEIEQSRKDLKKKA